MTSCHLPLYVAVAILGLHPLAMVSADGMWNAANCQGTVADILCCKDDHCYDYTQPTPCDAQTTCVWNTTYSTCLPNRDKFNNVCCQSSVNEGCNEMINGRCPSHFEVPVGCCRPSQILDPQLLILSRPNTVCCNTPCQDAKDYNCEAPENCTSSNPWGRSLGGYGAYGPPRPSDLGFNSHFLPKFPTFGQVLPYNGFGASYHQLPGKEHASVGEVQEMTVDDLLTALVEALSNDKDVFSYSSEIYSDPIFGKTKHGGPLGSLNLPDPEIFLRQEYGNPYGNSRGQFGFQGKGWPGVQGVYPGSGYGYLQSHYNFGYPQYGYQNTYQNSGYGEQNYNSNSYANHGYSSSYDSSGYTPYGSSGYTPYGSPGYGLTPYNPYGPSSYNPYGQSGYSPSGYGNPNQSYGDSSQDYSTGEKH